MPRKPKKFAVPLNISVSQEVFDRAHRLQQHWDAISYEKYRKRYKMSDLGQLIWEIGLEILEELDKGVIVDTIAREHLSDELIEIEVKKAKKALKAPKALSDLTDNQIEDLVRTSIKNE